MKHLILPLLLLCSTASAASKASIANKWVNPYTQTATVAIVSDLGFPLAVRGLEAQLNCKTGQVSTSGYIPSTDIFFTEDPKPSNDGNAKMLALKVLQVGAGVISVNDGYEKFRFSCKNGAVVTDYSAFKDPKLSGSDSNSTGNVLYRDSSVFGGATIAVPGYWYHQPADDQYYSPRMFLEFGEDTLAAARTLAGVTVDAPLQGNEALFVESADKKTLLPVAYSGGEQRIKPIPLTANSVITVWYAPDYNTAAGWQQITFDMKTSTATSTLAPKPKGMTMGQ